MSIHFINSYYLNKAFIRRRWDARCEMNMDMGEKGLD